ncbi:recombinase family protein [Tissierella creatinophila]|uniref:Transposon gamma-delta resolvase n=1 Tax=Tissierella creatinophila DSM 6911 TaxID=1123403 RepID=A0A1U7M6H6_TISCR|nr:recombinase family protein [Tissierella creatinophila]OLS02922.1 hypothetical protein TICRE_10760 [Tissierella creatinophila DSM 6911]
MIKAASYARYSSDNQREESIEAQLSDNRKYANKNDMLVVAEYVDRALSGRSDNREAFQNMINDAKNNNFNIIIVHKVDRFARNRYDSAVYKSVLKKHEVRVVYAMQNIEDSPEGALMEGILESFAEYYSLNLAAEVMKGMKQNAKKAKFNGGTPPLGFDIDEDKSYVINSKEAYIVNTIFKLYLEGNGYKGIANQLNDKGYRNKKGKEFVFTSIPSILQNEKYAGVYTFNKTARKYKNGRRNLKEYKATKDIIRVENALPNLIPMEVFNMTQEEIKRRSKSRGKSKSNRDYFLSGLIKCEECRRNLSGYSQKRSKESTNFYYYYRCPKCNLSIRAEDIESKTIEELDKLLFSNLDKLLETMHKYIAENEEKAPEEINYLESELINTNKEVENIINMITKGIASLELGKKLEDLETYKEGIETRLKEVQVKSSIPEEEIKEWILSLKEDIENKVNLKRIMKSFIKEIRVNKKEYEIDFFIEAPSTGASGFSDRPPAPFLKAL